MTPRQELIYRRRETKRLRNSVPRHLWDAIPHEVERRLRVLASPSFGAEIRKILNG